MKPQNNKDIQISYLYFSVYLLACILIGICIYICFLNTSFAEVKQINKKTEEYDRIYSQQIELVHRIDSLYHYSSLINGDLNDISLQRLINKRKQEIEVSWENMNKKDVQIHQKLIGEVNTFLDIKDSIRLAKKEEIKIRNDLLKCSSENKQTNRKLTIGKISKKE